MDLKDIKVSIVNRSILIIEISRSEVFNALRTNTLKEISHTFNNCSSEVRCVILTGNNKVFAAGADINELDSKGALESINDIRTSYWESIKEFKKPIIAAVNGFCLGGGCELAMHCDIIIAGDSAQFGQPEINLGIIPGAGGTQRMTKAIGKSNTMLMLLTGEFISAKEAKKMNLISEVVPVETTMIRATQIASIISKKSPIATSAIKSAVLHSYESGLTSSLKYEKTLFSGVLSSDDKKEGIRAFKEKRKPKFKGL